MSQVYVCSGEPDTFICVQENPTHLHLGETDMFLCSKKPNIFI